MKTIADSWETFEARVLAPEALPAQRHDMRVAFYAGVASMLAATLDLGEQPEAIAVIKLETLHNESRRFFTETVRLLDFDTTLNGEH
jgi:hypothetical protein